MRIGMMLGPERGRYSTKVDRLRADAQWADESGFASVWIPQIPDEFDALTAATVARPAPPRSASGTAAVRAAPGSPLALGAAFPSHGVVPTVIPWRGPGFASAGTTRAGLGLVCAPSAA